MDRFTQIIKDTLNGRFPTLVMGYSSNSGSWNDGGLIRGDIISILNTYEGLKKIKEYGTFKIGTAIPGEFSAMEYKLSIPQVRKLAKAVNTYMESVWEKNE